MTDKEIRTVHKDALRAEIDQSIVTTGLLYEATSMNEAMKIAAALRATARRIEVLAWKIQILDVIIKKQSLETIFIHDDYEPNPSTEA